MSQVPSIEEMIKFLKDNNEIGDLVKTMPDIGEVPHTKSYFEYSVVFAEWFGRLVHQWAVINAKLIADAEAKKKKDADEKGSRIANNPIFKSNRLIKNDDGSGSSYKP